MTARLGPPRLPLDVVARPRLTRSILDGLAGPLTLVCAPAGFGKTVALQTAVEAVRWPVIWLSLEATDKSVTRFVRYLVAAIQQHYPDTCRSTLSLFHLPELPPTTVVHALQGDLDALPDDCVVVIDDYQVVASAEVDAVMAGILQRLPPQVHLAVASRTPPAWSLARLRAAGLVVDVDTDQLLFTHAETRRLLSGATLGQVDERMSASVHQRMGGWAAAVRMAAIALRHPTGKAGTPNVLEHRAEPQAARYLLDEIVAQQPPVVTDFLVRTAICERISPALADELMRDADDSPDSAAVLQQIEEAGLFVTREGEAEIWYRYHDLLRASLKRRLRDQYNAAQIRALHNRASVWFAREGRVEEAVRHALLAGEREGAAAIIEAQAPAAFERHDWPRVAEWLNLLPPELLDERPALLLAAGWVAHRQLDYGRLTAVLERVAQWLADHAERMPPGRVQATEAERDALRAAYHHHLGDRGRAFNLARSAWERLPAAAAHARGQAGCTLGTAAYDLGRPEVLESLLESSQMAELAAYPAATLHVWLAPLYTKWASGDLAAAKQLATYIERRATEHNLGFLAAWAHYFSGRIHYEWNELETAAGHHMAVVELRHCAPGYALRASLQHLMLINLLLGQPPIGSETIAHLLTAPDGPWVAEQELGRACEARLALLQGNRQAAFAWLHGTPPQHPIQFGLAGENPAIMRVELLLAEGSASAIETAAREAAELLAIYTARHDSVLTVELLTLQALAADARGNNDLARDALEQAVRLGSRGGFVRTFVDRGPALMRLLAKLPPRDDTRGYIDRLRAAWAPPRDRTAAPVPRREAMLLDLTEPLTTREMEVMDLLARRFSNKEIATTLCVSWQTVAKHTANIYQKLRVAGRREAVERAAALGIFPAGGGPGAGAQPHRLYMVPPQS